MPDERGRKILIIDGHSLAHRAYHALPATLTRADGTPTNAVLGFCNMVMKLLEEEKPDRAICAFDTPAPTFRHDEFEDYKATRKPMDDALRVQMPIIRQAAQAFGLAVSELEGWEADDVIGTVSRIAEENGDRVIIVTGDKDALQLASDRVRVFLTRRGISEFDDYGPDEVRARYGFGPELIPDFKGLMGDPSDNIPGVPGVGEKTASRLIVEMGSVEEILDNVHSVKQERLKNNLIEYADQARGSKHLAMIDRNAPVEVDMDSCCIVNRDNQRLADFLREQGFRLLLSRMGLADTGGPGSPGAMGGGRSYASDGDVSVGPGGSINPLHAAPAGQRQQGLFGGLGGSDGGARATAAAPMAPPEGVQVDMVTTPEGLADLARKLSEAGRCAFDVVGAGGHANAARIDGLAFWPMGPRGEAKADNANAAYVPVGEGDGRVPVGEALAALRAVFEDASIEKLCHDAKEKMILLAGAGCGLERVAFDSMIGSYLADPAAPNRDICDITEKWLGTSVPRVRGCADVASCLSMMPQVEAAVLACVSSYGMEKLYREVEMPLVRVLADMETTGIRIDSERLRELSREMDASLGALVAEIYELAGTEFNINSTKQLGQVLFERLGLPPLKKTKTGYSTDAEVLEALSGQHRIVQRILDYRTIAKLKSTYVDALPELVNPNTGRIHTSFNQTVTATGRLSSTDPNLQNIPVRTEEGRKIRGVFIPGEEGWVMVSADYSQIELRVLAHISQDPVLIESFLADEDIHSRTAAEVFGVRFDDVTKEMRSSAKAVNFGIVYGISDYGLSKNIGVSPAEAREFIQRYFERYKGVRNYMDSIVAQAKADGYVTTLMNRRRYLPELSSPSAPVRKFAERVAMNTPIQGSAADIIKKAMVSVHRRLKEEHYQAKLLLQVHDELVLEAPEEEAGRVANMVCAEMSNAMQLSIPLKVDSNFGRSWMDAK